MDTLCKVIGCNKKVFARSYCNMHYSRFRRDGSIARARRVGRSECLIDGCDAVSVAYGYCNKHHIRFKKHGDPEKTLVNLSGVRANRGEAYRFYKDVVLTYDGDECLEWPYNKYQKGYGQLWSKEKDRNLAVSRLVCIHFHGQPPKESSEAAHSCGNPACCNHKHIRWATPSENCQDKKTQGTWQGGEANGNHKLTGQQVREIRLMKGTLSQRKIAKGFGVHQRVVWAIFNGKMWSHIT